MKKVLIPVLLLCLLLSACAEEMTKSKVESVFSAFEAECSEMRLVAWSCIADKPMSRDEQEALLKQTSERLGLAPAKTLLDEAEDYLCSTMLLEQESRLYSVIVQSVPQESWLLLSATSREGLSAYTPLCHKLKEAVGEQGELNALLIGRREGLTEMGQLEQELKQAFADNGVEYVEGASESNFVSLSGCCAELKDSLSIGGRDINIQIAACNNEQEARTYFYLGYPLLYNEY